MEARSVCEFCTTQVSYLDVKFDNKPHDCLCPNEWVRYYMDVLVAFWLASKVEAQGHPFLIPARLVINPGLIYCFTYYRIRTKSTHFQRTFFIFVGRFTLLL